MTRTGLAERLLEQATAIAWKAAGLGELSDADINIINSPTTNHVADNTSIGVISMEPDGTGFSRITCIGIVFRHLGLEVGRAQDSRAIAVSRDGLTRICCLTSKNYGMQNESPEGDRYWFTIYEQQLENIQRGKKAYVALGCGSKEQVVVVPADEFNTWTDNLPPYTQGKTGWHIQLEKKNGRLELRREGRGQSPIDVSQFLI